MKALRSKDQKNRTVFSVSEKRRCLNKFVFSNLFKLFCTQNVRGEVLKSGYFMKFFFLRKGKTKLQNRCIFTNRPKSIFKKFNSSRFVLRNLMQFGLIPGYSKSVW